MTSHSLNLSRFIPALRKIQMQTTFSMMQDVGTFVYTNKIGPSRKQFSGNGGASFLKPDLSRQLLKPDLARCMCGMNMVEGALNCSWVVLSNSIIIK